jgi:nicotinamide phosphoribosyltransferase
MRMTPFANTDAYKLSHWVQYPDGVTKVYSNFTPRYSMVKGQDEWVFFGLQAFLTEMNEVFQRDFFDVPEDVAVQEFITFYKRFFGITDANVSVYSDKVKALHQLGYIPVEVLALPEGSVVNHGVPVFTIINTHDNFAWITNFLETWMSCAIWKVSASATTAYLYRKEFNKWCDLTSDVDFMPAFQGHDFSFRGQPSFDSASASGAAHLISFLGTDTCPALHYIDTFYAGDDNGMLGTSVPATEHSVMCAGGETDEMETYRRLLEDVYPAGILSVVSDTWDFWRVVTEYLPALKDKIMARDGKIVIRPDSSPKTPVEIICGDPEAPEGSPENKGLCQCLYEIFGGSTNSKGFIDLDSHIGMIYGEAISLPVQTAILEGLAKKGFASTNVVLGIGSFAYQYVTRDTHGIAIKATAVVKDGKLVPIFKNPKTDNGGKKSAFGLLKVIKDNGKFALVQNVSDEDSRSGELKPTYLNGEILNHQSFAQVRAVLAESL